MSEEEFSNALVPGERLSLVTKVAKLYHESHVRQPEIAERLNLSQSRVSRLLKQAVAEGIVRTIVVSPDGIYGDLEMELSKKYGLIDAVIAEPLASDELSLLSALGSAGATYLESTLAATDRVGLSSWSSTLLAAVNLMVPRANIKVAGEIVQVIGGVGHPQVQVQANHLAEQLARVTGAEAKFFPAPGLVGSAVARDALMSDRYLGTLTDEWSNLSTLLAGIGTLQPSPLLASSGNAIDAEETEVLRAAGAVGDVCLRFFDRTGKLVDTDLDSRVLGIASQALLSIPRRIGIAGGDRKYDAILGAIRGGWVNVLVTDLRTASRLTAEL